MNYRRSPEKSAGVESQINKQSGKNLEQFFNFLRTQRTKKVDKEELRKSETMVLLEDRLAQSSVDRRMEETVGNSAVDDVDSILNVNEKQIYRLAIDEYVGHQTNKDYREVCLSFLSMPKSRIGFKNNHDRWVKEYEDGKLSDLLSKEDFIKEKSKQYIREVTAELRGYRIEQLFPVKEEMFSEENEKQKDIVNKIEKFIAANAEELRTADNNGLKDQFKKFKLIFNEEDLIGVTELKLQALFDDLVSTVVFEFLSLEEMDVVSDWMVKNVFAALNMSNEQWLAYIEQERNSKAKGVLKEYITSQQSTQSGGSMAFSTTGEELYGDVKNYAGKCGVFLENTAEDGVYQLKFRAFMDPNFDVRIKIIDGENFELISPYVDKSQKNKKYNYINFQYVANWQMLEHELSFNKYIKMASGNKSQETNSLLPDNDMIDIAETLFGFKLRDRQLSKEHKLCFGRLVKILFGDENGTFETRKKQFSKFMLENPSNNSTRMMRILKKEGLTISTLNYLIERTSVEEEEIKESTGIRI